MPVTVGDVVRCMEEIFPPDQAEAWDSVGLTIGDPSWTVRTIAFAVDPCEASVNEAMERGADILITHHPLYLRGTHSVAATSAKGRWTTRLIESRIAQFSAHTNADVVASTHALAEPLGITLERPLDRETGIGGVGVVGDPCTLREFAQRVSRVLPRVPAGILVGGDLERRIERVAICSGAGDSLLAEAKASGADVYMTADLRHHPATDHLWDDGCALINMTHWASEWPLLTLMRRRLEAILGDEIEYYVSEIPSDPWSLRI
ncbi:Nif3-like dinuclear metal center hexameric protein [Arcanobacterium haemolyticum]|nr:Nif3-like dinuclear metal center hexameric protein [Arcanobacterium haemolyticum]